MKQLKVVSLLLFTSISLFAQSNSRTLSLTSPHQNGRDVEYLQKQLIYLGYDIGPDGADGWFGLRTESALKSFQEDSNLMVTGRWQSDSPLCEMDLVHSISEITESRLQEVPSLGIVTAEIFYLESGAKIYTTFFGSFQLDEYSNMGPFEMIGLDLPMDPDFRTMFVSGDVELSPSGRYLVFTTETSYELVVLDLLTEKRIYPGIRGLDTVLDLGLRELYSVQYMWISENLLAFNPVYDYQGLPGDPGHEGAWREKLGELAGTSDPIDAGWFVLTLGSEEQSAIVPYDWFLDPPLPIFK